MKGMEMEGDPLSSLHYELQSLKKSVNRARCMTAALLVAVVVLIVALIAVGASQEHSIRQLRRRSGLLNDPNVTFASKSGDRSPGGLTYGGSLFRGSGFWSTKNPLPGQLTDHAAIAAGQYIYIIGGAGADINATVTAAVWKYDSVFHNYTRLTSMPQQRYRFGATLLDNGKSDTIYVVGGRYSANTTVTTVFIYDIPSDTWTHGPSSPFVQSDNCAASLYGKVYQIGGYDDNYAYLNLNYVYDPATQQWSRGANMTTPRGDLMCVPLQGEIYALGGYYNDGNTSDNNSFAGKMESFNPNTSTWTGRPDLLTPRGDAAIAVLEGNRIMLVGGEGHYLNDGNNKYPKHVNEVYYAEDETWVQKAFIPTARFRTAAATSEGLTYVFGGADVCPDMINCPALDFNEVFLDLDHPHVYIYLKNEAYNDNAGLTTYPL